MGSASRALIAAGAAAAAALAVAAPAASAMPAVGLNPAGTQLVMYDTGAPSAITERHDVTGLKPGETLMGLDVRPSTGQLYALGIVRTAFDEGRIYVVDPGTGAATAVGPSPFKSGMSVAEYGFDFTPVPDRIRVVSSTRANLRVNPDTGGLAGQDDNLNQSDIDAVAYDQNVAGTPQTTLWGFSKASNQFIRIGGVNGAAPDGSPNNGMVFNPFAAPSGITTTGRNEMDFAAGGAAFLTAQTGGATDALYSVNMQSGAVALAGNFSEAVEDLALLKPSSFRLEAAAASEDAGSAIVTVTREGNTSGTQTVAYATADGSATSADYGAAAGTLTFGPSEASKTFAVPVTNDTADEPAETVAITLSAPTGGAALGSPSTGALTILDDDGVPPPADTLKPQLLLSVPSAIGSRAFLKGLAGSFSCSEGCSTRFTLKLGKATIGTASKSLAAAGKGTFRVKLSSKGKKAVRKALKKKRRVGVSLAARGTDAAGNAGTARASVKVSR